MRLFAKPLLFLFFVTSPFIATGLADAPKRPPVEDLIDQAKAALDKEDDQKFEAIMNRLFERITGFTPTNAPVPQSISDEEYIRMMCDFDRMTEQIYSPEHFTIMRNNMLIQAHAVVGLDNEDEAGVRAITECVTEDGRPTKRAQIMLDEIAWAKTLDAADMKKAQNMALESQSLIDARPDVQVHKTRLELIDWKIASLTLDKLLKETRRSLNEGLFYQVGIVDKADKGDLVAQLEVARRLETGNKFRQDSAMAYFWYTRALQNGGGKIAQAGVDRILPRLTPGDFASIDIWTRNKHRPF